MLYDQDLDLKLKLPHRARCFRNPHFRNIDDMELMAPYRTQRLEPRPFFPPTPIYDEDDSFSGDDDDSLTPQEYLCLEDRMAARGYHWIDSKLVHIPQRGEYSPSSSPPPLPYDVDLDDSPQSSMDSPLY